MRDKSYIVYKHVNKINGKVYIGITKYTSSPNKRWVNGKGYKHCIKFLHAIKKYGWKNFNHIILCSTSKETAVLLERAWIKYFKSKGISYNIGEGGEGSKSFSEETKNKLRQYIPWIKGKHHTLEVRNKISEAGRRPCKEETKIKISLSLTGRSINFSQEVLQRLSQRSKNIFSKAVIQLDKNNNILAEYPSATEAEKCLGGKGHHISCCCNGKRKSAYGFIWKYKYE